MTGVGAPAGRYNPMLTVVPGEGSGHEAGKGGGLLIAAVRDPDGSILGLRQPRLKPRNAGSMTGSS
jgi:hypothetical protein